VEEGEGNRRTTAERGPTRGLPNRTMAPLLAEASADDQRLPAGLAEIVLAGREAAEGAINAPSLMRDSGLLEDLVESVEYMVRAEAELQRNLQAESVRRAIADEDPKAGKAMDVFLQCFLNVTPSAETRLALFTILMRGSWSHRIGPWAVLRYLGVAVRSEAWRIRMRERKQDRIPRTWVDGVDLEEIVDPRAESPLDHLVRAEARAVMSRVLEYLEARGTARDRTIIALVRDGCGPAEVMERLGLNWSAWQAFKRKAQRRLQKSTVPMSSKRLSTA
jgi:hypothetical protein